MQTMRGDVASVLTATDARSAYRLIADLDSEEFEVRIKAQQSLRGRWSAVPALNAALRSPAPEIRRASTQLLADMQSTRQLVDLAGSASALVDTLQAERGQTNGYLGGQGALPDTLRASQNVFHAAILRLSKKNAREP